jgi:fructose-bisphosphate aldolase class II
MTAAIRKYLNEHKSEFDPRSYLKPAREAAKQICKQRYEQFGCSGMASKIKPVAIEKMAQRYAKGELAQVVN